ncbi:hypothetical protein CIP107580_01837 [Corynebacterium diphtheriae]|uniref:hypothetical protein n=1 Tax=Corynebacterium diphtheriae TaxID=1717 RepID=UPI000B4ABCD4|nr:hypothetical protein [Corynebacterium diphtheriae]OWO24029.1 hypothetical protein AY535_08500 [Corynebacterium diphtheriae bv. gravis]CAB0519223.1 hypothetical protein CIP101280_01750 [Corynebacterium diphtheriae]CAB0525692.1 hypothetical protein CIP101434_02060 [Corynebacterium diphtheriae]CAB0574628.1 hypothetical protein CIP107533_01859 [Corynebacterium diphtheriae]CAB0661682.1 hypothetical protein CIP107580_01837 [Corynebacterium diphtheriae]
MTSPRKPLWKKWWIWLIISATLTATIAISAVLIKRVDGFKDEATKESVWEVHKCRGAIDKDADIVGRQILIDLAAKKIPSDEVDEARRYAVRMTSPQDPQDERKTVVYFMQFKQKKSGKDICDGWLWEYMKRDGYWDGYKDFTKSQAVEEGLYG